MDSIVIVGSSCNIFKPTNKFEIRTANNFIKQTDQKKTTRELHNDDDDDEDNNDDEEDNNNDDEDDDELWYEFRLGGSGNTAVTVLFSIKKFKDKTKRKILNTKNFLHLWFDTIVRSTSEYLSDESRSIRYGNLKNFTLYDHKKMPVVYPEDWNAFSSALMSEIDAHKIQLRDSFDLKKIYFMKYMHGIKQSNDTCCPNFVKIMYDKMDVDMTSTDVSIIQVHLANTFEPKEKNAIFVNYSEFKKQKQNLNFTNLNNYNKFFLRNFGGLTCKFDMSNSSSFIINSRIFLIYKCIILKFTHIFVDVVRDGEV